MKIELWISESQIECLHRNPGGYMSSFKVYTTSVFSLRYIVLLWMNRKFRSQKWIESKDRISSSTLYEFRRQKSSYTFLNLLKFLSSKIDPSLKGLSHTVEKICTVQHEVCFHIKKDSSMNETLVNMKSRWEFIIYSFIYRNRIPPI